MRSKNLVPVQVILPQSQMGSNHSEQRGAFEEALQTSIEASLRTSGAPTLHVFSSLYHRSKPYAIDDRPGTSSVLHTQRGLLPPPDNGEGIIDVKPDVSDLTKELSRQNQANDEHASPGEPQSGRTSSVPSNTSPRELQNEGNFPSSARGPPPLLVPQAFLRPPTAVTSTSTDMTTHSNNVNRNMMQRLPAMLPKNLQIEQLKHAQEQVKHLQHLQRWHLLQARQQQVRAVANSLSQIPRLPLFNPLMPASALNRNPLMNPGSAINGAHNLPQQQDSTPATSQSSPGSPMFRKGYCKGGKDIRLSSLKRDGTKITPYPNDYSLVAMSISPSTPQVAKSPGSYHPPDIPSEAMVVVAISVKCLPPQQQELARPLLAQCIGCGETSLHTFATLSSHINLRTASPAHNNISLSGVNPLQRHARNFVLRDNNMPYGCIRGAIIPWQVNDVTPPRSAMPGALPMLPTGGAPQRPKANIMSQQQRPQLKFNKHDGRSIVPASQPTRPTLLPPGGVSITHRDLVMKAQPTTSSPTAIILDSPPDGSTQSPSTNIMQKTRADPDWNSTVKLPENLPDFVGRPLILICWEWQQLQSNIQNVHITHSFVRCFEEASTECHNTAVMPLSREMSYFVMAQYLSALENHEFPTPASLSAWLGRSRLMITSMKQFQISASNVVALVRMAISNCLHKIGIVISQISQAHAVNECIANLKPGGPRYHIVAHINGDAILDLSILLTGHTSRLTREFLMTSEECADAIRQSATSDAMDRIEQKMNASRIHSCIAKLSSLLEKSPISAHTSFVPLLPPTSRTRATSEKIFTDSFTPSSTSKLSSVKNQITSDENNNETRHDDNCNLKNAQDVADTLFTHVSSLCDVNTKLDLSHFSSIQFCFVLPPSPVVKAETMTDITSSGVLQELGICSSSNPTASELHKVIFIAALKSKQRFNTLCEHIKLNSSTLYVLFCIDSHLHCDTNSVGSQWMSTLTNEMMAQCRNLVMVSCTHIPQALHNQNTSIPFDNALFPRCKSANVSSLGHCTEPSEISTAVTFDLKHESNSVMICDSFPEIQSPLINCKLVTMDYISTLALCISSCERSAEEMHNISNDDCIRNAVSPATFLIFQDLLSSKSGITVLLRVPSETLATRFASELTDARKNLKMQKAFEIMLYGSHAKPHLSDHFLQLVRTCKSKPDDWTPETLCDVDCIPLLLIYTGKDVTNHLMPNNLKYVDLRLLPDNIDSVTQSSILAEMSLAHPIVRRTMSPKEKAHGAELYEPVRKKTKEIDSDEDALHMDTFSDDSESEKENPLKWKSFDEKEKEISEFSSNSSEENLSGKKRKRGSSLAENALPEVNAEEESFCMPTVIMSRNMHSYIQSYLRETQKFMDLPTHSNCEWVSHARTVIGEKFTAMQTAGYLRKWTRALPSHPDFTSSDGDDEDEQVRNILLVTPPRARVPLACCLFIKKMNEILVKLLQVDVYDHKLTSAIKPCYPLPNADLLPSWPVHTSILDMDFDTSVINATVTRASQITNGLEDSSSETVMNEDVGTSHCLAGNFAALDVSHQICDLCRSLTPSQMAAVHEMAIPNRGISQYTICDGTLPLSIIFIIPPPNQQQFSFQHHPDGKLKLSGLNLHLKNHIGIKTPIFSLGISGAKHGLYNLDHTALDVSTQFTSNGFMSDDSFQMSMPMHIVVVKRKNVDEYKASWPNKVLMVLPESFDDLGVGAMKYAVQCVMQHSLTVKQEISSIGQENYSADEIWSFALLLDDSAVMWMSCSNDDFMASAADYIDESSSGNLWKNTRLSEFLRRIELVPSAERYAAIGVRQWCSNMDCPKSEEDFSGDVVCSGFSKCHLMSCYAINAALAKEEMFDFSKFLYEDIDWFTRISSCDLPLFRFNDIAVATKVMPSSARNEITALAENPRSLVSLADSDHKPIMRHPNYLLEAYLAQLGDTVFQKAKGNSRHPVLVVDRYVSLGPEVFVEFASSKSDALPWATNTEKTYSGLLLYCQSNEISVNFLEQFQFTSGATVCVVGRDRSSLRQTVVNLHLENDWHFRLTDEYQTTNDTSRRKPLFYLTGVSRSSR